MRYIQRKASGQPLETVDECETRAEAKALLIEYKLSDKTAYYYTSRRPCKSWAGRNN